MLDACVGVSSRYVLASHKDGCAASSVGTRLAEHLGGASSCAKLCFLSWPCRACYEKHSNQVRAHVGRSDRCLWSVLRRRRQGCGQPGIRREDVSACGWPSTLGTLGSAGRDVCRAARAFLSCETDGGGVACASEDFVTCSDAKIDAPLRNCKNDCKEDEYVALCGGVGPGPVPEPPAGCHATAFANPAGTVTYCCPCE